MLSAAPKVGSRVFWESAIIPLKDSESSKDLALNPTKPRPIGTKDVRRRRISRSLFAEKRGVDLPDKLSL
jgi:hypothetical protein